MIVNATPVIRKNDDATSTVLPADATQHSCSGDVTQFESAARQEGP